MTWASLWYLRGQSSSGGTTTVIVSGMPRVERVAVTASAVKAVESKSAIASPPTQSVVNERSDRTVRKPNTIKQVRRV